MQRGAAWLVGLDHGVVSRQTPRVLPALPEIVLPVVATLPALKTQMAEPRLLSIVVAADGAERGVDVRDADAAVVVDVGVADVEVRALGEDAAAERPVCGSTTVSWMSSLLMRPTARTGKFGPTCPYFSGSG